MRRDTPLDHDSVSLVGPGGHGGVAMHRTGRQLLKLCAAAISVAFVLLGGGLSRATAAGPDTTYTGTLPDGATYLIDVPADWNGTLVLYSHGYVTPGSPNPARDIGDPLTGQWLLSHGYALAGSSYATTGWAIREAIPDQIATLDTFAGLVGTPSRTIAWGHSLGGIITAGLLQDDPGRFTASPTRARTWRSPSSCCSPRR